MGSSCQSVKESALNAFCCGEKQVSYVLEEGNELEDDKKDIIEDVINDWGDTNSESSTTL